jgi:2-dehydropantoate 2-reductase
MKILIVGAGIIGTIYGWALSKANHDITHFVRPGKSSRLKKGVKIDLLDGRKSQQKHFIGLYEISITENISPSDGFELVIVPTKPYQLEAALQQIVPIAGEADFLLLTQNWSGTESIDAILPPSRYLYGDAKAGGAFKDETLQSALFPSIDLGQTNSMHDDILNKVAALFEGAGIKPTLQENILHYIWLQYAINAGLWPALVRIGSLENLLRNHRAGDLSLQAVRECVDVVARRGVNLNKYPEIRMFYQKSFIIRQIAGLIITLMFRFNKSIQRTSAHALGDPIEIKTAYYDLINTGKELAVPMPVTSSFEDDIIRFALSNPK